MWHPSYNSPTDSFIFQFWAGNSLIFTSYTCKAPRFYPITYCHSSKVIMKYLCIVFHTCPCSEHRGTFMVYQSLLAASCSVIQWFSTHLFMQQCHNSVLIEYVFFWYLKTFIIHIYLVHLSTWKTDDQKHKNSKPNNTMDLSCSCTFISTVIQKD